MNSVQPLRIAIVNDYELVVRGLARMMEPFEERVVVVEIDANEPVRASVDVALLDTFANPRDLRSVLAEVDAARVAVYTWELRTDLIKEALRSGADGYLAKHLPATELVDALERVARGERVVIEEAAPLAADDGSWPGREDGLTVRESEIIALITQGLTNQDIADRAFLSINTIKSYIRSSYRKMNVTSRSQAVLWGIGHGFRPDYVRVLDPVDQL